MPVYNGMPYIREAIDSLLGQSLQDWELVIGDNGSTDGTLDYLGSFKDSRIRVFRHEENLGVYGNLNFLLGQAKCSIAKILCADDLMLGGALEEIARFMEDRPNCAISGCWAVGDSVTLGQDGPGRVQGSLPQSLKPAAAVLAHATFGNPVGNLSQAACRPQLVIQAGGFDPALTYYGDREAWARVSYKYGLEIQKKELIFERSHPGQYRNILNRNFENVPQLNATLETISKLVDKRDLEVLRKHWTIHFLSVRVAPFVRLIMARRYALAISLWKDMPVGISALQCMLAFPLVKYKINAGQWTTRYLYKRILELNGV